MAGFVLELPGGDDPLFLQIARAVADDVRRGRLRPGDALPGSRTLATTLGVHRNTVLAAFRELAAEGWIEAQAARATRVRSELPDRSPRRFARSPTARSELRPGFDLGVKPADVTPPPPAPGAIALLGGLPDLGLVPARELARAYRRVAVGSRAQSLLGYGDPRGEPVLRAAIAAWVSRTRGLAADADDVVITRGSQMALYLAARATLRPGDVVAVEELGYRPAWEALRSLGAELAPVPVDGAGLDVDALAQLARARRVRAVYVTPHHQYPTTALLPPERRLALLELARRERWAIFEDDYDHEFHYEGRPVAPLASADATGQVVYFGTLSKILAPALRLGFVLAPRPLLDRITLHRALVDRQGDRLLERAIASLVAEGEVLRHARRMRRVYEARRAALAAALTAHLGARASFVVPAGGMALWVHVPGVDVDAWAAECAERGVVFQTARRFTFDGAPRPYVRLGFAAEPEARLRVAIKRMAEVLARLR